MSEIVLKTYELLDELEKTNFIKTLKKSKSRLLKNKKALSLINKYNSSNDSDKLRIKKELYEIEDYKLYMSSYNELSMIVLRINKKYQEYTSSKNCKK